MMTEDPQARARARILVVDDNATNVRLLAAILEAGGYAGVQGETDPRRAVTREAEEECDVLLLDMRMPDMNGLQVLQGLAEAGGGTPRPLVIALVAAEDERTRLRALSRGARDTLPKPFSRLEVLQRVDNMVELAHLRRWHQDRAGLMEQAVRARTASLEAGRQEDRQRLARIAAVRDDHGPDAGAALGNACALLAQAAGLEEERAEVIREAALLHDVGKLAVSEAALAEPGPLSPGQWEEVKQHTVRGARLLEGGENDGVMCVAREIALYHHERWDGGGYPEGLAGTAIPVAARIVAIADCFDSLTRDRPYRAAWPVDSALAFIREGAGQRFDSRLVEAFLGIAALVTAMRRRHESPATPAAAAPPSTAASGA